MSHIPSKTSILIVDDDANLRRTLALILQHKDYVVETAADGVQAVEWVRERPFDMVLMDIRMPVMDGVQALKQIKGIRPQTAVTMMTAYAIEDLIQDALDQGAFALLNKPVEIDQVIALVEQAWRSRQSKLILLVDDDPAIRITLYEILTQKGYHVCTAGSGEDAIVQAHQKAFDILLIDLKLPTLNGLETYLAIKEFCPQTVAIVFTAFPLEVSHLAQQALDSNAYTYLCKPLDIDQLLELIREIGNNNLEQS